LCLKRVCVDIWRYIFGRVEKTQAFSQPLDIFSFPLRELSRWLLLGAAQSNQHNWRRQIFYETQQENWAWQEKAPGCENPCPQSSVWAPAAPPDR
jgi:hypothetical protein